MPAPGVTEIFTTEVGKTSRSSNAVVVAPPVLVAVMFQAIDSLTPTWVPAAGEADLLTTTSAGDRTGRLEIPSQLDGLQTMFAPDISARLVTLILALADTKALMEYVTDEPGGIDPKISSSEPVPELVSQETPPLLAQVQVNWDSPNGTSSINLTELASLLLSLATRTVYPTLLPTRSSARSASLEILSNAGVVEALGRETETLQLGGVQPGGGWPCPPLGRSETE